MRIKKKLYNHTPPNLMRGWKEKIKKEKIILTGKQERA
jgi:hypothetical protein